MGNPGARVSLDLLPWDNTALPWHPSCTHPGQGQVSRQGCLAGMQWVPNKYGLRPGHAASGWAWDKAASLQGQVAVSEGPFLSHQGLACLSRVLRTLPPIPCNPCPALALSAAQSGNEGLGLRQGSGTQREVGAGGRRHPEAGQAGWGAAEDCRGAHGHLFISSNSLPAIIHRSLAHHVSVLVRKARTWIC